MNIIFYNWIHPSGYKIDDTLINEGSSDLLFFSTKKEEIGIRREINLDRLINDIYQTFKHIPFKGILLASPYYLYEYNYYSPSEPAKFINDNIDRALNLVNKYGLVDAAKSYSEDIRLKKDFGVPEEHWTTINSLGESLYSWEILIQKVMSLKFNQSSVTKSLEIGDIKLTLDNNKVYITPLTLLSAVDCYSYKRGISICGYCDAPFVQKRTNQEYCGNSCRASASRKRQSKD